MNVFVLNEGYIKSFIKKISSAFKSFMMFKINHLNIKNYYF